MSNDRTTEILNYLSAMSRDIGAFRAEVKARFDRLEGETNARFDGVEKRLDRLDAEVREGRVEVRLMTSRLDRIEAKVLENKADVRDLGFRVAALESREP